MNSPRVEWFKNAKYGVMCHYLAGTAGAPEGFCVGPDSYSGGKAFAYYKEDAEGVVTFDVPISLSGEIPEAFIRQLAVVRRTVR